MKLSILKQEGGATALLIVVLVSALTTVLVAAAGQELLIASEQAARTNKKIENYNAMNVLAGAIGKARQQAAGTCPTGTTSKTLSGHAFCFPSGMTSGNSLCMVVGKEEYCMYNVDNIVKSDNTMHDELVLDFVPQEEKATSVSGFLRFILQKAYATAPSWTGYSGDPNDYYGSKTVQDIPAVPTNRPGNSTDSRLELATYDPQWTALPSWGHNNRVHAPDCGFQVQNMHRGCMICTAPGVDCLTLRICRGGTSCSNPYRQRIAIYN